MKKYIIFTAFILSAFIPASASAATVYLEASRANLSVGDTAVISVKINAEGAVLNTIDGDILLKSAGIPVTVKEFSLANSAFGLWPRTPSLSTDGRTISFVGGVPGGFSIEGATVFKFVVEAKKEGIVTIAPENMSVFLNDGNGSKALVALKDIIVTVSPKKPGVAVQNDWAQVVSQDTIPPEDFIVVLGRDQTLFEGKKFAFFSAVDNQSGIDHYEVSEHGAPAVRSGSTYVFQDQDGGAELSVIAYDKAGNKKVASYSESSEGISWPAVILIVALGIIARITYRKLKRK